MQHIQSLQSLINELCKLPGIGVKTAQRLAYFILKKSDQNIPALVQSLNDIQANVKLCNKCFDFTEQKQICDTCTNHKRNAQNICVVEDPSGIQKIESAGVYNGLYHVLHGSLSPLDGIGVEDLKIAELFKRIEESLVTELPITEIIFALDPDLEGDTSILYISKQLSNYKNIKITQLAHGVPVGGDIEYINYRTLAKALENRIEVS
ncbi:MAG: recombination protein RecR [Bdellovibrionales bacterium]|nr:recombination protein RecR [Bdellovibrionales bacterium]